MFCAVGWFAQPVLISRITSVCYDTNIFCFPKMHLNPMDIIFMGLVICPMTDLFSGTPNKKTPLSFPLRLQFFWAKQNPENK